MHLMIVSGGAALASLPRAHRARERIVTRTSSARALMLRLGRCIGLAALAIVLALRAASAAEPPDVQVTVPSPGTVSIAIGSAPGPGAVTVREADR